jgi:hypothetical protein
MPELQFVKNFPCVAYVDAKSPRSGSATRIAERKNAQPGVATLPGPIVWHLGQFRVTLAQRA